MMPQSIHIQSGMLCRIATALALALLSLLTTASAQAASPWWHVTSTVRPAVLPPGGEGTITVNAVNIGDASSSGNVTLHDVLPPGVSVVEDEGVPKIRFVAFSIEQGGLDLGTHGFLGFLNLCEAKGGSVSCGTFSSSLGFEILPPLAPFEDLEMQIAVRLDGGPSGSSNKATVLELGSPRTSANKTLVVGSESPKFGAEEGSVSVVPEEAGGGIDVRAGGHPFQVTSTLAFNQNADPGKPPALARNVRLQLPPGFLGSVKALPQCSDHDFRTAAHQGAIPNRCASDTVVGVASVTVDEPATLGLTTLPVPLFNLVPAPSEPARFGFEFGGTPVSLDTAVRTGRDYGVTVSVNNITELTSFLSSTVTLWGVPGDPRHDPSRGWGCLVNGHWGGEAELACEAGSHSMKPFLTLPTSCTEPFTTVVEGESWPLKLSPSSEQRSITMAPASYTLEDGLGRELKMSGCNQLDFSPSLEAHPSQQSASTPSGIEVRVKMPQEANENSGGRVSSAIKDTTVSLPQGVAVNASSANGLEACSESGVGYERTDSTGTTLFTPTIPAAFCPDASKIGTVKFRLPLLENPVEGAVYLASQNANPFGSLIAMYVVAQDPVSGVLVKLAGEVQLSETGQIVTTLRNLPQAPVEDAIFKFFDGSRAPLVTPGLCGRYETTASFTPWSGTSVVAVSSPFEVTSGPHGGACPGSLPFQPGVQIGTNELQAGAFAHIVTTITNDDGSQDIQSVHLRLPPGLAAMIASVTPCTEEQANQGTCSEASKIGETTVTAGLGGTPYTIAGGGVYLTGPYRGAPFGLSIVNEAKAGPFDLGKVVVRAKVEVDPLTAQVSVTTDSTGPYAIPHIIKGIPLELRRVEVVVNRSGFAFNPTNCVSLAATGEMQSTQGAKVTLSVPFRIANCRQLRFDPRFSVATSGRTSKANGAGLTAKVLYPATPPGIEANIAQVKVVLPKQLPSRLSTLQKACLAAVFEDNPAKCPAASIIGHATVHTPVLPVPLAGPAYFVSHGGEAFPSLTMVLQGDDVTVELVGSTLIRKGITSTTFKSAPDVPFRSFELTLPQGRFSALAAFGNLCKTRLVMPTEFTAQNGLKRHQNTKIDVTGCRPHVRRAHRTGRRRKH